MVYAQDIARRMFYRTPEIHQIVIAQYYNIPVLSLRNAVYHYLRNETGAFKVRGSAWLLRILQAHLLTNLLPLNEWQICEGVRGAED